MRRLAHRAVYNIFITGVIVLSNEMIIDIPLMRLWQAWPRSFTLHSLVARQLLARQQELPCDLSKK